MTRPCWTCGWQQIGGDSFLGLCRWFEGRGEAKKAIPGTVVDVGCKFWMEKTHGLQGQGTGREEAVKG